MNTKNIDSKFNFLKNGNINMFEPDDHLFKQRIEKFVKKIKILMK